MRVIKAPKWLLKQREDLAKRPKPTAEKMRKQWRDAAEALRNGNPTK